MRFVLFCQCGETPVVQCLLLLVHEDLCFPISRRGPCRSRCILERFLRRRNALTIKIEVVNTIEVRDSKPREKYFASSSQIIVVSCDIVSGGQSRQIHDIQQICLSPDDCRLKDRKIYYEQISGNDHSDILAMVRGRSIACCSKQTVFSLAF